MNIFYIGTYPPRECGIGTFTKNLLNAMVNVNNEERNRIQGFVVAISDNDQDYLYPEEVKSVIRQEQQADYLKAANFINHSGTDLCILEHEFGIFGGQNGVYILPLLHRLEVKFPLPPHRYK